MTKRPLIAIFGEAMLELSEPKGQGVRLAVGGDTQNTAIYLARSGLQPHYISALGEDPYSSDMIENWQAEGIRTDYVLRHPTRLPGLYAIKTDDQGERRFFYWREHSAARDFFNLKGASTAMIVAAAADLLYVSGISLSLYGAKDRAQIIEAAKAVKARGGDVAFDPNYRPRGWASAAAARAAIEAFAAHVTLALPTGEDDDLLFGEAANEDHAARWASYGARACIIKRGPDGAFIFERGESVGHARVPHVIKPVDATGAGDSFNGAFLSALMRGASLREAADAGNRLAGIVIQHPGAIIPKQLMPA